MITFEEALAVAKKLKPNIDACDEYDNAYLFKLNADRFTIGGDGPCVILKETGRAINQVDFFDDYDPTFIQELDIP